MFQLSPYSSGAAPASLAQDEATEKLCQRLHLRLKQQDLRHAEQRLSLFIDRNPLAVIHWSPGFEVVDWNPAAEKIFGYRREEMLGQHAAVLVADGCRAQVNQVLESLLQQRGGICNVNENVTREGKIILCQWYNIPLVTREGYVVGVTSMVEDISDRRRAELALQQAKQDLEMRVAERTATLEELVRQLREQALVAESTLKDLQQAQAQLVQSEKMTSLGQLVAGIAHEINNPTSFIYGNIKHAYEYSQALFDVIAAYQSEYPQPALTVQTLIESVDLDFLQQDFYKLLNSIAVGAERIQTIVQSLRTFARTDEAEVKPVDLNEGIDSTLLLLQHRLNLQQHRPAIQVIKYYGQLPKLECYAGQMNQVFMNLLSNAIDALEARNDLRKDALKIHIRTELTQKNAIKIQIADNGAGIAADLQSRIFDPFFTTKPIGAGTGMGLSTSYQIITERHNGTLHCTSTVNQGSVFIIEIPVTGA